MSPSILLSICIPTFNRSAYLKRLLNSIVVQIVDGDLPIDIHITDNASTDSTEALCLEYCKKYDFIKYVRQESNLGPDDNIAKAYNLATGKYVWIFGDDDYLRGGVLSKIIGVLNNNDDIDLLSIKAIPHVDGISNEDFLNEPLLIEKYIDNAAFSEKVGVMFTFISGMIVNRNKVELYDFRPYMGTYLVQLGWIFRALRNGTNFMIIKSGVIFVEQNNSGGYRFFEVFSVNLSKIVKDILGDHSLSGFKIRLSAIKLLLFHVVTHGGEKENYVQEKYQDVIDRGFMDLAIYAFLFRWLFIFQFPVRMMFFMKKIKKSIFN
ncbi:glycosyltransferase family 2 protein [Aeromonas jandaei]|nr:glycosyltransferase family 2 protein [Aeromonas jandaei]